LSLEPAESLGTGLVISAAGLILTAAHVVEEAQRIRVKVGETEPVAARTVFADEEADIALLRLQEPPSALQVATLGDSDGVRKGETVYVIGNPVGIERSLSVGVVSGRHQLRHVFGGNIAVELIQTDAAINSGNSGGPIFNSRGEVIAVAERILTEGGGSEGLGFGLAINVVKKILALDPCTWLGFSAIPLDERWSRILNVPRTRSVLLQRVIPEGPADRAGLREARCRSRSGRSTSWWEETSSSASTGSPQPTGCVAGRPRRKARASSGNSRSRSTGRGRWSTSLL
ncbi:MAG TPA: trypsin-like peptidase domain-containing protein, partial [Thermoanaerobaculales bacterium]|nr:trypsin-like peptidase domain-containing protein [Thermoanaerobaculales bacterium]